MKRSSTWFALILIASALLLRAAPSVNAQNLGPSQSLTQQGNKTAQQAQSNTKTSTSSPRIEQTPSPVNSENGQSGSDKVRSDGDKDTPRLTEFWKWIGGWLTNVSGQAFFNLVMTVATVFVAIFTGQLVYATRKMQTASEAALHVNRPFLLVTDVKCLRFTRDGSTNEMLYIYEFDVCLRNFGIGPADIVDYIAVAAARNIPTEATFADHPSGSGTVIFLEPGAEPFVYYAATGRRLSESLVAPNEWAEGRIKEKATLTRADCDAVRNGKARIGIDGIIRYRGAPKQVYWTRFFWWCFLDAAYNPVNIQRALRSDLNDHS